MEDIRAGVLYLRWANKPRVGVGQITCGSAAMAYGAILNEYESQYYVDHKPTGLDLDFAAPTLTVFLDSGKEILLPFTAETSQVNQILKALDT